MTPTATYLQDEPTCRPVSIQAVIAVALVVLLPLTAGIALRQAPPWQFLWGVAVALYASLKWLTFATFPPPSGTSLGRILAYLLLWPGMNPKAFFDAEAEVVPSGLAEWLFAASKFALGILLVTIGAPKFMESQPLVAGWNGMVGLIFVLHFGVFHILSLIWRQAGIAAEPIMNWPILATGVNDFWGRRWNLAFRDLSFTYLLKPLAGRLGAAWAMLTVFVVSGLVHELVITVPVGGGWGGPTIYFVLQGVGMLVERSDFGKRLGLGEGIVGRAFAALVTLGPVALLFPEPFVRHAILPTLAALGIH